MTQTLLTVHELRSRWKPIKERLNASVPGHPTAIRLHRTFSWMARCESATDGQDLDLLLICRWIAFNGLYGRWDAERREPLPDRQCWRTFVDQLLALDTGRHLSSVLIAQRELVMAILGDEYLSEYFWEEPTDARAGKSKKAMYDARTWYIDGKWSIRHTLDRACGLRTKNTPIAQWHVAARFAILTTRTETIDRRESLSRWWHG